MQVREVMSQRPDFLDANATIREAARHMRDKDIGFVPIASNDKLLGTLTDRDLAVRVVADGKNLDEPIGSIVTEKVLYCFEDADVREVLQNMREQRVQRLIVLNNEQDKDLAGIVSVSDIADKCQDDNEVCKMVCQVSRHYH